MYAIRPNAEALLTIRGLLREVKARSNNKGDFGGAFTRFECFFQKPKSIIMWRIPTTT